MDFWITLAQAQFWVWTRKNLKTRKNEDILVQGALRPSLFGAWEYIFPEECLPEVLVHFGITVDNIGTTPTRKNRAKLALMRKLFGAKKIPQEIFDKAKKIPMSIMIKGHMRGISQIQVPGIAIHPIGIKKDARLKWKKIGYEQEML